MNPQPGWQVLREARTPDPHLRDWLLWCDWSSATGRPPLPAEPEHIAEFVAAMNGGSSLRRRRIRSIVAKCDLFGEPVVLETAEPRMWHEMLGDVSGVLQAIPRWGWPSGMNRRRDAFVVVLAGLGLTRRQMCWLEAKQVKRLETGWTIDDRPVPYAEDPSGCSACAVSDWLTVLGMVAGGGRGEAQQHLTRAARPEGHRCHMAVGERWRNAHELVPAIDRHGWVDDGAPVTTRTISQVLRNWTSAASRDEKAVEPQMLPIDPPASGIDSARMDELLDDLDARVDAIIGRVESLMRTVGQG